MARGSLSHPRGTLTGEGLGTDPNPTMEEPMPNERERPQPNTSGGTGSSRLALARPAQRRPVKARLAISGPPGSGKTWTGLSIATYLCPSRPILWIDTESNEPVLDDDGNAVLDGKGQPLYNTSAELYADSFDNVQVIPWLPPYSVVDLTKTIQEAGRSYGLIGVDSSSHFWQKEGGTLDRAGGQFGGWRTARPEQDALVQAILGCPAHVIMCTRAKVAYEVQMVDGRQQVTRLGMEPIQSGDLEYEMQVVLAINEFHRIDVGKTRAAPLAGRSFHANGEHEFAGIYADWLSRGKAMARMAEVEAVRHAVFAITDADQRALVRKAFLDEFGPTEYLEREKMPDVWVWLMAARGIDPHPFEPVERDPEPPSQEYPDGIPGGPTPFCRICGTTIVATWHDINAPRGRAPGDAEANQEGPEEPQEPPSTPEEPSEPETAPSDPPESPASDAESPPGATEGAETGEDSPESAEGHTAPEPEGDSLPPEPQEPEEPETLPLGGSSGSSRGGRRR